MDGWGIVQTHANREAIAAAELARKGFENYLPRIAVTSRRGTRRPVPLFPGYLFVRIARAWYPILSTNGVLRLLRNGQREPARIEDVIVRDIRAREVRGIVRLPKRIAAGDRVRIVRGSFRDQIAVYEGMSGKERQRVLLEFLGRQVRVELDPDDFVALNVAP